MYTQKNSIKSQASLTILKELYNNSIRCIPLCKKQGGWKTYYLSQKAESEFPTFVVPYVLPLSVSCESKTNTYLEVSYADMLKGLNLNIETFYAAEKNIFNILIP